jgi:hypothetical protein
VCTKGGFHLFTESKTQCNVSTVVKSSHTVWRTVCARTVAYCLAASCGVTTSYGPSIAVGTQLLLRNCYGSSTTNGTRQIVSMTAATAAATSGLTIVVENSMRVAVQVYATSIVNIANLKVIVHNVSNDAAERFAASVVCSPSSCKPLVNIYQCHSLVNATVTVYDVVHVRNKSVVYGSISGTTPLTSGAAVVVLQQMTLADGCVVLLSGVSAQVTAANYVAAFQFLNAASSGPSISVYNFTTSRTFVAVVIIFFVNTTSTGGAVYSRSPQSPQSRASPSTWSPLP